MLDVLGSRGGQADACAAAHGMRMLHTRARPSSCCHQPKALAAPRQRPGRVAEPCGVLPAGSLGSALGPTRRARAAQGESKARFVERVQQALAAELGIPISDVTLQAKRAMIAGERARAGRRRGMRR